MRIYLHKTMLLYLFLFMSIYTNAQRGTRVGYIDMNVILERSWMVGDSFRDIGAAKNAGMLSVLVGTGLTERDVRSEFTPDFEVGHLEEAIDLILGKLKK